MPVSPGDQQNAVSTIDLSLRIAGAWARRGFRKTTKSPMISLIPFALKGGSSGSIARDKLDKQIGPEAC
jgi:hypothetical protein